VGRKIARDGGAAAKAWIASVKLLDAELAKSGNTHVKRLRAGLAAGVTAVGECVDFVVSEKDPLSAFAGAVPLLKLMGIVAGGWQMARAALACEKKLASKEGDRSFHEAKLVTARFYGEHVLVQAPALRDTVVDGSAGVMALTEEQFLAA
jgi:butyryl-CoA dehydrogenase